MITDESKKKYLIYLNDLMNLAEKQTDETVKEGMLKYLQLINLIHQAEEKLRIAEQSTFSFLKKSTAKKEHKQALTNLIGYLYPFSMMLANRKASVVQYNDLLNLIETFAFEDD